MKKLLIALIVIGLTVIAGSALAADTAVVNVTATVAGTCKVLTGGTVSFTLDPSTGGTVSGIITQPTFWCTKGTSYTITDSSPNKSGTTYKMKHDTLSEYIPYSFTYTAAGTGAGKNSALNPTIISSVAETDYMNATAGTYKDTVTLTIAP